MFDTSTGMYPYNFEAELVNIEEVAKLLGEQSFRLAFSKADGGFLYKVTLLNKSVDFSILATVNDEGDMTLVVQKHVSAEVSHDYSGFSEVDNAQRFLSHVNIVVGIEAHPNSAQCRVVESIILVTTDDNKLTVSVGENIGMLNCQVLS